MKISCLYFDKKYKCVFHSPLQSLTLITNALTFNGC